MAIGSTIWFSTLALFVVFGILVYLIMLFNGIIQLKNQIKKSWANIDVLLKQRSDMLPNLVSTVKGYAKYEKGIIDSVVQARKDLLSATNLSDKAKASDSISKSISTIFGWVENYPQLKANENFLELQRQISQIENEIADRRELFNDSVTLYNNNINSFPGMLIAKILKYTNEQLFQISEEDKKEVEINLADN